MQKRSLWALSVLTCAFLLLTAVSLSGQTRVNGIWSNWFSNVLTLASATNGQMLTQIKSGSVDPEGAVTAPPGSIYLRTNGNVYKKTSGTGNTDWDALEAGSGTGDALTSDTLAQFAATSCAQFASVISGESGTCGTVVLSAGPTFTGTITAAAITGSGAFASTTLDTGQGANELYDMDQNVLTTSSPTFVAVTVDTEAYDATGWNGDNTVPTKDAVRDEIESIVVGGGGLAGDDIDACSELAAILDDETGTCGGVVLSVSPTFGTSIIIGSAGVSITEDGDGAITLLGRGNGSDEDLTLNLDDTSNVGLFSSSTGLAVLSFSSIDLQVPTEAYDSTGWNGDLTVPTKDAIRDILETFVTFTDPGADRFVFWDDSEGELAALTMPAAFAISGTTATLTLPMLIQFNAGVCQNATASVGFSTPSTLGATAGCHTVAAASGDPAYGYAVFPGDGSDTELHGQFEVPSDWTGAIDVTLKWNSANTTTNDVVWEIAFGCVATNEAATAISFNETAFTAVTNLGTTLRFNVATKTGIDTTGCAAGETAYFIIHRDTDTAGDTLDQAVNLISAVFTVRRSIQ